MLSKLLQDNPVKIGISRKLYSGFTSLLKYYPQEERTSVHALITSQLQEKLSYIVKSQKFNYMIFLELFNLTAQEISFEYAVQLLTRTIKSTIHQENYLDFFHDLFLSMPRDTVYDIVYYSTTFDDQRLGNPLLENQPELYLPDVIILLSMISIDTVSTHIIELKKVLPFDRFQLLFNAIKNSRTTTLKEALINYLRSKKSDTV